MDGYKLNRGNTVVLTTGTVLKDIFPYSMNRWKGTLQYCGVGLRSPGILISFHINMINKHIPAP